MEGRIPGLKATVILLLCQSLWAVEPPGGAGGGPSPPSDPSETGDESPQGPIFISEPRTRVEFTNTQGVTVSCSAYGRPAPALDWVRADGSAVDDVPGLLRILPNNSLHIPAFEDEAFRLDIHKGTYRCMASNIAGIVVSRTVGLNAVIVSQYRSYNVQVNDLFVTRDNTAVFRCLVKPHYMAEHVTVSAWTRNGAVIQSDSRTTLLPSGELMIQGVRADDSYLLYRCVTHNNLTGAQKTSDPASLNVIDPTEHAPFAQELPRVIHAAQGDTAQLPCAAGGFPVPGYAWSRDGVAIRTDQSRVSQQGGNLLIETAGVRDSGEYVCSFRNSLGEGSTPVQLIITAPLSAYIEPHGQTVDVGGSAVFSCSVSGHPILGVTWYKDGTPLVQDDRTSLVTDYSLRIANVERLDRGMYQCLVWNDLDNTQAASQLSIGVAHPQISEGFADRTMSPDRGVSLRCVATGNPTPSVAWTLDDSPLPPEGAHVLGATVTREGDVISYLNLTSVRVEDGGLYRCTASNNAGSAYHVARLNVYGVPYIRPMSNVTAVANDILVLRCYVSGYPVETITWRHGDAQLPVNHRQQTGPDGLLTIRAVSRDHDEGQYSCDARNSAGLGMRRTFYITVMEPPEIDAFSFPRGRKQGDRVSVSCVVSSGDLPIGIDWTWNGRPVPPDIGIQIQKLGTYSSLLSISNVQPRHNGNFTCTASNAVATANHTAVLHVNLPPVWVLEPADSYVIRGGEVMLDCQTSGDPAPTVTWRRATEEGRYQDVGSDDVTGRVRQIANGSLAIREAGLADGGSYLCHSTNGIGTGLSKLITLEVHVPATFSQTDNTNNYTVRLGEAATMESVANGDKPLSLSWSFNGGNLDWQRNGRLEVSYFVTDLGRGSRLTVKPTTRADSGFYVSNAKNYFGSDSLTIYLTVLERPDPPVDFSIHTGGSREVSLRWSPAFDGNSPISAYVIQVKTEQGTWEDNFARNVTVTSDAFEATVADLSPANTYLFRIRAVNGLGLSDPSDGTSYSMQEEAPSGSPENVDVIATGSQSLVVSWQPPAASEQNGAILGYYIGYKVYNASVPYIYETRTTDQLAATEEPLAADGSLLFEPPRDGSHVLWMTISPLQKFTQYAVHVQAYNEQGAGPRSSDAVVFTLEDVPSQPPQEVQAVALSSQHVMVVWGPPPLYTLHGILQGYKLFYKPVRDDEDESDSVSMTTDQLSVAIFGLQKFTNYSIQVLAYTRKGEGVRSPPIYVRTQPDLPERPADIKAVPAGPDAIFVSWKAPLYPNGDLTKYTLYIQDTTDSKVPGTQLDLPPTQLSHLLTNLTRHHEYSFRVGASTVVGAGELTYNVKVSTTEKVGARVASFSGEVYAHSSSSALLTCVAVGDPAPTVSWRKRSQPVEYDDRVTLLANGSLLVENVQGSDAANYTCRAENVHGADESTVVLIVQVTRHSMTPPRQPHLSIAASTSSTVQINWRSGSNGGSKIQGFSVHYKREHGDWKVEKVPANERSHTFTGLRCGTQYSFNIRAFNRVGDGVGSETVHAHTNGSVAIMPAQSLILKHVNATYILLDLGMWQDGGCPLNGYDVQYQYWGDTMWHLVQARIDPTTTLYRVDLRPATWYVVRVTAFNEAGSTDCVLKFSTTTYEGKTIEPVRIVRRLETRFYERAYIMIPLCAVFVVLVVLTVGVALYCRRRQLDFQYKAENASNLRKDLTTESFLMGDVDKVSGEHMYSPDPSRPPNNSVLVDFSGGPADSSTGGGDHSSSSNTDDEGNIKPYATFPKHLESSKPLNTAQPNTDPKGHGDEMTDPDLDKLPPPPADLLQENTASSHTDGGRQRQSIVSNVSSNHEELLQALGHLAQGHPSLPTQPQTAPHPGAYTPSPRASESPHHPGTTPRHFTHSPARPNEHRRAICQVPLYDLVGDGSTGDCGSCTPPLPPPPVPAKPSHLPTRLSEQYPPQTTAQDVSTSCYLPHTKPHRHSPEGSAVLGKGKFVEAGDLGAEHAAPCQEKGSTSPRYTHHSHAGTLPKASNVRVPIESSPAAQYTTYHGRRRSGTPSDECKPLMTSARRGDSGEHHAIKQTNKPYRLDVANDEDSRQPLHPDGDSEINV